MKKLLCKPCAKALEARGKTVKPAATRCEKITCAECGRRRFGVPYDVTGWPIRRKRRGRSNEPAKRKVCPQYGAPGGQAGEVYGGRMGWRVDPAERYRIRAAAEERDRESRWSAPGRARVVHPVHGTVVVPHSSNLAAIRNAAEVWRCCWTELADARVWAAEPGDVAAKKPYII